MTTTLSEPTLSPPPHLEEQDPIPPAAPLEDPSTPELGDDARTDPPAVPLPTSQSDSSSTPTSSSTNSLTAELHFSSEPDTIDPTIAPTIVSALAPEEFPNPFEHLPAKLFHTRVNSAPAMSQFLPRPDPQPPHRLPSVLRPSHPRSFNSVGSRPSSLALSMLEFEAADPRLGAFDAAGTSLPWKLHRSTLSEPHVVSPIDEDDQGDRRLRSSQSFHHGDDAPPSLSPDVRWHLPSSLAVPSSNGDHDDAEPHIEVSERMEDQRVDLRPKLGAMQPPKPNSRVKKTPKWKFWIKSGRKHRT